MTKDEKKYFGWLWTVKLLGRSFKLFTDTTVLSPKDWRVYYDDGFEPFEALKEDLKYSCDFRKNFNRD